MEYRKLGNTDIEVSVIALGCWPFAGGQYWGNQDDSVSIRTVHTALNAGINFFDTAEGYEDGHSERVLGEGLKGRRNEAVIATKVSAADLAANDVLNACEQSLVNLQTDYIDLYQIHWPNWEIPLEETVEMLLKLKQQGKIRAIGVSNFAVRDLSEVLSWCACETDQLPYSLLWRVIESEIQPLCVDNGVGIICYSPLAQGLLTGRYTTVDEVPEHLSRTRLYASTRSFSQHDDPGCEDEVFAALNTIRNIAEQLNQPMANVSLAWARQQPGITSLLVGARNPQELEWNLPAIRLNLPNEALSELSAATETIRVKLGQNPDMWMSTSRMR